MSTLKCFVAFWTFAVGVNVSASVVDDANRMGIQLALAASAAQPNRNVLVSPITFYQQVALHSGENVVGLSGLISPFAKNSDSSFRIMNVALDLDSQFAFSTKFQLRSIETFGAYFPLTAKDANTLVRNWSEGLLPRAFDVDARRGERAWAIESIPLFRAAFSDTFRETGNAGGEFQLRNGHRVHVRQMFAQGNFAILKQDGKTLVRIPLKGDKTLQPVLLLLPNSETDGSMSEEFWLSLTEKISRAPKVHARVTLPIFAMNSDVELTQSAAITRALGLEALFGNGTAIDHLRAVHAIPTSLQKLRAKAFLDFSPEGAQAIGGFEMGVVRAVQAPPQSMLLNRPFSFVIADELTGAILYMGIVQNAAAP